MNGLDDLMSEVAATQRAELERLRLEPEIVRRVAAATDSGRGKRPTFFSVRGLTFATAGLATLAAVLWVSGAGREGDGGQDRAVSTMGAVPPRPELSFVTDGVGAGRGRAGDVLAAGPEQPMEARFSDGSELVLAADGRARVVALHAAGASVALERGKLDVHVIHRPETRWQITADAYRVRVTGTRFAVTWNPPARSLTVRLSEGSVEVTGPGLAPDGARVSAGQELRAGPTGFAVAPAREGAPAPQIAPAPDTASSAGATRPVPRPVAAGWRALASRARYHEALSTAIAGDFSAACRQLSASDLMLLGDVARLDGDAVRAEQAYRSALTRFRELDRPSFALGVLAFEARHDYRGAATWFASYLREHPTGPLATEAAGRLLEALHRAGETTRARTAAVTYLRDHPNGPHAALARSLAP
jgi:transmembrane sensor